MNYIVAGPYVGELGFEYGNWAPYIAQLKDKLSAKCIVFSRSQCKGLYPFCDIFIPVNFSNAFAECNFLRSEERNIVYQKELEHYLQLKEKTEAYCKTLERKGHYVQHYTADSCGYSFRSMFDTALRKPVYYEGSKKLKNKWDKLLPKGKRIVLVFRGYNRGNRKNTDVALYNSIIAWCVSNSYVPIVVGRDEEAYSLGIKGVNLINKTTIDDLIAIYNISDLAVGFSTGALHLAGGCRLPHIAWGGDPYYWKEMNLQKTWMKLLTEKEQPVVLDTLISTMQDAVFIKEGLLRLP